MGHAGKAAISQLMSYQPKPSTQLPWHYVPYIPSYSSQTNLGGNKGWDLQRFMKRDTPTLQWLHQVIFHSGTWHHTVPCCGAVSEPAGLQLPTGNRTAPLARWAVTCPEELHHSCYVSYLFMQFCTDYLLLSFYHWMIYVSKHGLTFEALFPTPCHTARWQSKWEDSFFSPSLISSLLWSRPCRNLILCGTSMPTDTRNTSMWKETDAYDFLLHFSCGTGTSQQAFSDMFWHL